MGASGYEPFWGAHHDRSRIHYSITIRRWHQNWKKQKDEILQSHGERWYRLWHLFLAWSWRIGAQGNAACFQIVANNNLDAFDRKRFVGRQWRDVGSTGEVVGTGRVMTNLS